MLTPSIKVPRLRVKILQHEIFTPVHWGKYITGQRLRTIVSHTSTGSIVTVAKLHDNPT